MHNVWHQGEISVQQRASTKKRMAEIGPKFIREFMLQQHCDFFQSLTMLFVAYNDSRLLPCASILFGDVNFIASPRDNERFSFSSKVTGRIRRYLKKLIEELTQVALLSRLSTLLV